MVRARKRGGKKIQKGGVDIFKHISSLFSSGPSEEPEDPESGGDCMKKCKQQCQRESSTSTDKPPEVQEGDAEPTQAETGKPNEEGAGLVVVGGRKKRRKRRKKTKKKKHKKHKKYKRKTYRRKKKGKRRTKKR